MNKRLQHIASLLLLVFTVSFAPFNFLHHHEQDEHKAASFDHTQHADHHCVLDEHFCQPDPEADCGHEAHCQEPVAKCFSCEFHFIKHYQADVNGLLFSERSHTIVFRSPLTTQVSRISLAVLNKGPPNQA